jgi:hypothetical protein
MRPLPWLDYDSPVRICDSCVPICESRGQLFINLPPKKQDEMETAIKASDFDGVSALLASGASVLVAAGKFTPLALAVQRGLREIADLLLDHGADPNLAIVAGNSSPPPRAAGDACLTP